MKNVSIVSDGMISPLGLSSASNYDAVSRGLSGITSMADVAAGESSEYLGRITPRYTGDDTWFETLCLHAMREALAGHTPDPDRTLFILSTTKGNIRFLEEDRATHPRMSLHATAQHLAARVGLHHVQVVSNACISGVLAMIVAKRFLQSGAYDHAVVVGADVLSHFVVSGFKSLHALSPEPCKPFDANRNGINLGEAAGCVILTTSPDEFKKNTGVSITGGGVSNDANHISGPSRTGIELAYAIGEALHEAGTNADDIGFISAHGTATRYNDEMEASAFHCAKLADTPLHSLKGNFGHTLGAAGIVETIMSVHSLQHQQILPTAGFSTFGVTKEINISRQLTRASVSLALKTASGFGGCNAAIVLKYNARNES